MKDIKKIVWGVVLLAVAVIFALNTLGVTDIDILFPGWWTLFIIIPCGVGLFTDKNKSGNAAGLVIGILLLVWQLGFLNVEYLWEICVITILLVIGLRLIVRGFKKNENKGDGIKIDISSDAPSGTAIFGGKEMNFNGQVFDGCELTAIFGGVECDLSGAIIEKDCVIKATAIFGGVDIILPGGLNIKLDSTSVFGGTDDKYDRKLDSGITVHVETVSIFGGVDLK